MANEPSLDELREKIDALDRTLLENISTRAKYAQLVGKVKRQETGEQSIFYRPERERQVIERLQNLNQGPLPDSEIGRLFREIMSACLALEAPLNIAYLGPEGTFTQSAALKQFGHSVKTSPKRSISDVFKAVETGECQYGIVPVENSTEGMVSHTLDTLAQSSLKICGEVQLRIAQNLLTHAEHLKDIEIVYSHSQSLAQCRRWRAEHLPNVESVVTVSNAQAAQLAAKNPKTAAIAGKMAADLYQLPIRFSNIEDDSNNTTRFLVLGNQEIGKSGHDKTSILVSSQNRPGLLYKLLEPIERHGVNMTRIESRPSKRGMWEYIFFIDLEGHHSDANMHALIEEMRQEASLFRVLGSYPRALPS